MNGSTYDHELNRCEFPDHKAATGLSEGHKLHTTCVNHSPSFPPSLPPFSGSLHFKNPQNQLLLEGADKLATSDYKQEAKAFIGRKYILLFALGYILHICVHVLYTCI